MSPPSSAGDTSICATVPTGSDSPASVSPAPTGGLDATVTASTAGDGEDDEDEQATTGAAPNAMTRRLRLVITARLLGCCPTTRRRARSPHRRRLAPRLLLRRRLPPTLLLRRRMPRGRR